MLWRRRKPKNGDPFAAAVSEVVAADLCSGCGGCTHLDSRVQMELTRAGYSRPTLGAGPALAPAAQAEAARRFEAMCPGLGVRRRAEQGGRVDPVFGQAVGVWRGYACDERARTLGSSAGVLTVLARWLVEEDNDATALVTRAASSNPMVSVAVETREVALVVGSAGSRYAPSPTLAALDLAQDKGCVVVKPCEAAAFRQLRRTDRIVLSFFCAGVPSQAATREAVEALGVEPSEVEELHYRGDGWPGWFRVRDSGGRVQRMSYADSWGKILGPTTQWRCKLCADGTGESADVSVGDYWEADERGFPLFSEADGSSVVIARTPRGASVLAAAEAAGVLRLEPAVLRSLQKVQPLQVVRRETLSARLLGVRLAGRPVPRYRGYRLWVHFAKSPLRASRAAGGSLRRARRGVREW